nr:uncharacterized protein LOC106679693 isoform X2 [Halyomorpha halys]XP_024215053.1 uncharacterized protein LOC106679693 isoform X2 [Halyomorpha halys]XP_024215054.1 uncharacterized protein LOC106679693 isoform X2 [Halyomorpha halys]XP_024215055.1 uncharacterized protein LOC106679693 isoform X2 [Halyomorpha halys]XP_024215056.1 uncharacterized protein LOC106679693 isoform X2 [Halyomorpha halys]XP_024215057.1 uncharacterized protein LOC106679693 isoform X2 [Halyomorpha halys]
MNQYGFNNLRNRMQPRNNFQIPRYQNYTSNFRQWNQNMMGYEHDRYQNDFRLNRGYNRQNHRMIGSSGNNGRRRSFGDGINNRNWVLEEDCFQEPEHINFIPVHRERKMFHRESSLPPPLMRNRIHEARKPEFFENRSLPQSQRTPVKKNTDDDYSSSAFKRTVKVDHKSEQVHIPWSDSESDSKDASWVDSDMDHKSEEPEIPTKVISKDEEKLISMIWSDESDNEDSLSGTDEISSEPKGRCPFKHTIKSLPRYDGKTVTGDEGMFEIKAFHCTYCNIICLDKEKSKTHMLTKYHYKHYKKELEKYEEDSESDNENEE